MCVCVVCCVGLAVESPAAAARVVKFSEILAKAWQLYSFGSLIFLGAVLKSSYFVLTQCIKLKHKDLESCLSRM